jgi:hypothetical protein
MVRKKTEGNEEQRRAASRAARMKGITPSALKKTTGASKQRGHLPRKDDHDEKIAAVHQGKQRWSADVEGRETGPGLDRSFGQPGDEYSQEHERVLNALAAAQEQHGGEAVYLDEIARGSGLPRERTRELLHDLIAGACLVTQLEGGTDGPDLGPRYEIKPRL